MHTHTTIRSWPALGFAGVILAGTCYVLFQDVINGAPIGTGHVLTAMALLIATAAGHKIAPTWRERRYALSVTMMLLAAGAILYVGLMSGARNAEFTAGKAERIENINGERERLTRLRDQAQVMLTKALEDVAKECASGEGTKCRGRKATRDVYDGALKGHNADLAKLGAPQTANAGYKAIAEGIVLLPWFSHYSVVQVVHALIILLPWLAVLISEFGVPAFLSLALGHRHVATISDSAQTSFSNEDFQKAKEILSAPLPENDPPTGGGKPRGRKTTDLGKSSNVVLFQPSKAKHEVIALLEKVGSVASNQELARLLGCSEGEARKRRLEVAHLLEEGWLNRCRTIRLRCTTAMA